MCFDVDGRCRHVQRVLTLSLTLTVWAGHKHTTSPPLFSFFDVFLPRPEKERKTSGEAEQHGEQPILPNLWDDQSFCFPERPKEEDAHRKKQINAKNRGDAIDEHGIESFHRFGIRKGVVGLGTLQKDRLSGTSGGCEGGTKWP